MSESDLPASLGTRKKPQKPNATMETDAQTLMDERHKVISMSHAANNAAKMAGLSTSYATYISPNVCNMLKDSSKCGGERKKNM
ncbi:MAG: hypothetical protein M3O70_23310 [Actinomycetota bacterium]|nr:hypothetical protein [Actinomycetota bacterium]